VTGSTVQTYVNLGYAQAASFIGNIYTQYRPNNTGPAIATRNYITNALPAYFDPMTNFPADNPRQYGMAALKAIVDPTAVQPGDYLVGTERTYFIASIQDLQPVLAVYANESVSIERIIINSSAGILPYGGERPSQMEPVLTSWPASVLLKGKKEKNPTGLGSDVPQTEMEILLPYASGVSPVIEPADLLTLSTGIRYAIENVELTDLGYRLRASMVIT
jgi:hypothetical protein